MIHVMMMRLSHARLSSTVFPLLEKFIMSRATEAVTMAAMVDISKIWLYTSFMISFAFSHIVAAKTVSADKIAAIVANAAMRGMRRCFFGGFDTSPGASIFFFNGNPPL
jgi:hypothetical protein